MTTEFDKKRVEDNRLVMKALADCLDKNQTMRFSQVLFNFGFVTGLTENEKCVAWKNEFSVEPGDLLRRLGEINLEKGDEDGSKNK